MQATVAPVTSSARTRERIDSIDLVRGLVMVVMALDHVRDYFHADSQIFSAENLARTDGFLFFTRWITHFCAPVFVFLAGVSIYFVTTRRPSLPAASRFLLSRGLWLIVLEWTLLNIAFAFNFSYSLVLMQVLWALGWSMIAMAALVWLPRPAVLAIALAMILLHNSLDGLKPEQFGALSWLWNVLHVPAILTLGKMRVFFLYPLIPWIGVMAAGYCLGPVMQSSADRRRRVLWQLGGAATAAFFVLRLANIYGDPQPWATQSSLTLTVVSFFRATKYPPSLIYLLMTLGPALLVLAILDRTRVREGNPFRVFGRVPMFYYLLHFYLVHTLVVILAGLRYGRWDFAFTFPPSALGVFPPGFPMDYGYSLPTVYLIWLAIVAALYLPCRWYMGVKQRSRSIWLSYL